VQYPFLFVVVVDSSQNSSTDFALSLDLAAHTASSSLDSDVGVGGRVVDVDRGRVEVGRIHTAAAHLVGCTAAAEVAATLGSMPTLPLGVEVSRLYPFHAPFLSSVLAGTSYSRLWPRDLRRTQASVVDPSTNLSQ
jgi:hypothetical protein